MGNTQGIKLESIENNKILNSIKIIENKSIIPYVHYIIKLNRFQVENFPKNHFVKEFTITNILTEKQNVIKIDNMELGYFFKDLKFKYIEIPELNQFILITKIMENSLSEQINIKENLTLLLGDKDKYFTSTSDIEKNLSHEKYQFLFYDIIEEISFFVDFKEIYDNKKIKENKNSETNSLNKEKISLGFECGIISRLGLLKIINTNNENKLNENTQIKKENIKDEIYSIENYIDENNSLKKQKENNKNDGIYNFLLIFKKNLKLNVKFN
jgi:hypothetical protein